MNPEANFDILFILDKLYDHYEKVNRYEIQGLCYISQLLSIYEGRPASDWNYVFINHNLAGPFSAEINNEIDRLIISGNVDINGEEESIKINNKGVEFLQLGYSLKMFWWRHKYLVASVDAALRLPLPIIINSINNEPMIKNTKKSNSKEILGIGINLEFLYEDFSAIKQVLGNKIDDVWMAAILWLNYLSEESCDQEELKDEY